MRKTALTILGTVVIAAAAGGFAALSVNKYLAAKGSARGVFSQNDNNTASNWGDATPTAGNHFTAYQAEQYPDLTYAAENAVKAVVNIESIREVQYGGGSRGYG